MCADYTVKMDVGWLDGSLQMVLAGVGCGVQAWRIGPAQHPNGPELPCSPVIVIPQTQNLGQRALLIDNTDSKPIYYVWASRKICLGATRADHPFPASHGVSNATPQSDSCQQHSHHRSSLRRRQAVQNTAHNGYEGHVGGRSRD